MIRWLALFVLMLTLPALAQRPITYEKDTLVVLIPLDMLFIAADGHILNIAERTIPLSETPIPSAGPIKAVLELNGGTSARLGIKPGDRVRYKSVS